MTVAAELVSHLGDGPLQAGELPVGQSIDPLVTDAAGEADARALLVGEADLVRDIFQNVAVEAVFSAVNLFLELAPRGEKK